MIKINITGDRWLDPSTCRIMFDLRNMGTSLQELRPLGGPWSFFRRMRCLCNGQVIEDIDSYNRVHELFSILTAEDSRKKSEAYHFGRSWDHIIHMGTNTTYTSANFSGTFYDQSETVLFKPLLGILNQPKYLPIRYCPITIELELVNDMKEPILTPVGTKFTPGNTSVLWQIENV